jgi:hypothetical protein
MLRGRGRKDSFILLLVCCFLLNSCRKSDVIIEKTKASNNANGIILTDANRQISGIWYRFQGQAAMRKSITKKFSWGEETFDYWNALCIDLQSNKGFLQFKDGVFNLEIISGIGKANFIELSANDPGSPYITTLLITYEKDGELNLSFKNGAGTVYAKELSGKYYRREGP